MTDDHPLNQPPEQPEPPPPQEALPSQGPPPSQPPAPPPPLEIDLTKGTTTRSLSELGERVTKPFEKGKTAGLIGGFVVGIFGGACFYVIFESFRVVFWSMDKPEHTKILINEAVIPLLEKVGTFLTTVFGPLLGFILGYYFGQRQTELQSKQ